MSFDSASALMATFSDEIPAILVKDAMIITLFDKRVARS